jgi:glycosyltransferase involved in cell wall biosynthesis
MRFADAVISNSVAALEELGMLAAPRMFVVPNGIDCERFQPRVDLRRRFRDLHRLDASVPLVGMVARLDKMKDHETFLKAARLVAASDDRVRFVVAGGGPDAYRAELISTAERLGLARRVLWLGDIHDPVDVYSALDVLVSASVWEGFSNTIAEAMACGVAVVATSVGDSTRIVGRLGAVVPPRAPEKVAEAMLGALRSDNSLRERARARILEEYSLDAMVTRTESILRDVSSARMKITE